MELENRIKETDDLERRERTVLHVTVVSDVDVFAVVGAVKTIPVVVKLVIGVVVPNGYE